MRVLVVAACSLLLAAPASALSKPAPTSDRIRVFSDELPDGLSPGLLDFAASRYAGAQKLGRTTSDALKRRNPAFFAIQYRLVRHAGSPGRRRTWAARSSSTPARG